jgi:hypothetical protein
MPAIVSKMVTPKILRPKIVKSGVIIGSYFTPDLFDSFDIYL